MEGPLEEANLVRADEIRPAGVATRTGIAAGIFGPKEPALIFLLSLGLLNKGPYEPKNAEPCASPPKIQFLTKVARHFTKGTAKVTAVVGRRCFSGALAVPHARTPAEGVLSAY